MRKQSNLRAAWIIGLLGVAVIAYSQDGFSGQRLADLVPDSVAAFWRAKVENIENQLAIIDNMSPEEKTKLYQKIDELSSALENVSMAKAKQAGLSREELKHSGMIVHETIRKKWGAVQLKVGMAEARDARSLKHLADLLSLTGSRIIPQVLAAIQKGAKRHSQEIMMSQSGTKRLASDHATSLDAEDFDSVGKIQSAE